jgi:transglutaminase-like putative cysteine protease
LDLGRRVAGYPDAGWTTVALAYAVAGIAAWSVESAHWVPTLPGFLLITLTGGLLGLIVAQSGKGIILPHLSALALGVLQAIAHTLTVVPGASLEGRLLTTGARVDLWARALLEGGASTDRLAFVLLLLFGGWLLSYVTVYLVLRTRSIWAILPSGFALFTNLTYLPPSSMKWLLFYLLVAGLLVVQLTYLERSEDWRQARARPTRVLGFHLLHAGFWFAVIVFIVTSFIPSIQAGPEFLRNAWVALRSPIGDAEGAFTRIFASLPARRSMAMYNFEGELPFRGNISLSDEIVMLVESEVPLYWRARVYDVYNSWGWTNAPLSIEDKRGLEDLASGGGVDCQECIRSVTVDLRVPSTTLYTAGTPLRVTVPVDAEYLNAAGPEGERLVKLESQRVLQPFQRYTLQTYVPNVSEEELLAQGEDYPDWVTEQYLALPDDFSARLRDLAERRTQGAETPYQKAVLIRDYLRTLEYSQDIQAPPPGRDALEHFLLTERAGYSDYFGSAMVALLRASGVPARLAVGYATGDYDAEQGVYVVREADAHAWTEVYFPDYGWVPFEPTPSQSVVVPGGPVSANPSVLGPLGLNPDATGDLSGFFWEDEGLFGTGFDPNAPVEFDETDPAGSGAGVAQVVTILSMVVTLIASVLAIALAVGLFLFWRHGLARPRTPAQAYSHMAHLGGLGGIRVRRGETPEEYADRLAQAVPEAGKAFQAVAVAYGRSLYGPKDGALSQDSFEWGLIARKLTGLALRRLMPRRRRVRRLAYES